MIQDSPDSRLKRYIDWYNMKTPFTTTTSDEFCFCSGFHDIYDLRPSILGKGAHGIVRECIKKATGQVFAVKIVNKDFSHKNEAAILSRVDNKNIIKFVGSYSDDNHLYIVTERCSGGELFNSIVKNATSSGCFSEKKAATVIKSVLHAVAYLHGIGVVHRDIKPENILFETELEENVKLIDFGCASYHTRGDSLVVGTEYYISPEMLKGKYCKSSDIWSVGVVAYVLLAGYPPFHGPLEAVRKGRVMFPSSVWSVKSHGAVDFLKCLLSFDQSSRYTAKEALVHHWITEMTS